MDPRDRLALREYRQHRLVLQPGFATPQVPQRVAPLDGGRALVRDLGNDRYYLAERQASGSVRYRPLVRTPEIQVRGRPPPDRPPQAARAVQRPIAGRPHVPAQPSGPTMMRPIPPSRVPRARVPIPQPPVRPERGRVQVRRYSDQLAALDRQLRELRDGIESQRATLRPPSPAPRPMITDPLDPRFVPPPPGGAELSSMQGRASPLAQQRIREREDAQAHLRHLRRLWDDLAQALHPYERPDPRAVSDWLYELVTTEHGTGPRWEMMQRADAERMRRALEFGDRLRSSPFHAAVYGVARLSGLSHEDAQAITEDPGYQLTFRLLRSLGIDDDDASQYATAVAVVTALIGFAIALRGRGRPSGQRPSTGGRTTAQPVVPRPNRAARRALQAQQRTAERRQQRARASAAREEQRRLRQARDVERRARISAETTRRALERARLRRELPHPHAQARTPNLRREFARDWGRRSPAAAEYRAEWERAQGFVGVYNPRTGEILVRPSPPNRHGPFSQPPAEWVRRGGGHGDLAAELSGMQVWTHPPNVPANQRLRAFTLVRDGDGFVIRWDSQAVNGIFNSPSGPGMEPPPRLPSGLRGEVIDAVRFHTGETIRDGG